MELLGEMHGEAKMQMTMEWHSQIRFRMLNFHTVISNFRAQFKEKSA